MPTDSLTGQNASSDEAGPRTEEARCSQLDDVADIVVSSWLARCSVLESATSRGWHELLEAVLQRLPRASMQHSTSSRPQPEALIDPTLRPGIRRDLSAAVSAAVANGQSRCLKLLLGSSVTTASIADILEARSSQGLTLLMQTASRGDAQCLSVLLEHSPQAQVAAAAFDGRNALMLASEPGHASCLHLLLAHSPGLQVTAVDGLKWNALMHAAARGHAACLQLLLAHSPELQVTATGDDGSNALICASFYGHTSCVELLLAHHPEAQVAALDGHNCSALMYAASNAHVGCLQLLLSFSPPQQQLDRALLLIARKLAVLGAQLLSVPSQLREEGLQCVQLLLSKGAKLSRRATDGDMAAMWTTIQELAAMAR